VVIGNRSKMEIWSKDVLDSKPVDISECISLAEKIPGLKI